ncbi:MAG: hypothetical protein AAFR11_09820 [Pseudomonadota bacterium]
MVRPAQMILAAGGFAVAGLIAHARENHTPAPLDGHDWRDARSDLTRACTRIHRGATNAHCDCVIDAWSGDMTERDLSVFAYLIDRYGGEAVMEGFEVTPAERRAVRAETGLKNPEIRAVTRRVARAGRDGSIDACNAEYRVRRG